jgi:short-subunit dehydrogenase
MPDRPTALVTGASSGIGRELALLLARNGHDLVLVARRQAELDALAAELSAAQGTTSLVVPADLSTVESVPAISEAVQAAGVTVDVLVNNAGLGGHGRFSETDTASDEQQLSVNILALTRLTKAFLPAMVTRRRGRILNVASTAAFQPGPYMAIYYASKAYVLSFTEALAEELRGTGVTATALCPGAVRTDFFEVAALGRNSRLERSAGTLNADVVAQAGYDAMMHGKPMVIPGVTNRIGMESLRIAPRRLVPRIVARLHPPT